MNHNGIQMRGVDYARSTEQEIAFVCQLRVCLSQLIVHCSSLWSVTLDLGQRLLSN